MVKGTNIEIQRHPGADDCAQHNYNHDDGKQNTDQYNYYLSNSDRDLDIH